MLEIDDPRYFRTESGQKMYALFKEKNVNLNYLRNDGLIYTCLLYTSDAADEEDSVDLGGRRIIKKKK